MCNRDFSFPNAVGRIALGLCGLACIVPLCGCGDGCPQRVEVMGTVTIDGQPLERGAILFAPLDGTHGPKAAAEIVDGRFHLKADEGPPEGRLLVRITSDRPPAYLGPYDQSTRPADSGVSQPRIPSWYNTASRLRVETHSETANVFHFELQTAP